MNHENVGTLYELDDEAMRKKADMFQAECEEIADRYGVQASFFMAVLRQKTGDTPKEDVELAGHLQGCTHCLPFFLAQAIMRDVKMAQVLADTIRWVEKLREEPEAKVIDLAAMDLGDVKPN